MKYLPLFLLLTSFSLIAQQAPQRDSIRVGLVLSGGGAKGLAQIGALKVIEQAGVKIDYIAGSSMGAVIGGLYAAGYTAEQLDSIFKTTDFKTLIQDDLPRRVKSFYQKEGSKRYALTLPFDHFKLRFPSGLSKGQNIYNLLARLLYPVRTIHDFSHLPIPFFCIGTNIETGDRLVLSKGSLPLDLSASAAIPSIFSPVKIGDSLISDGGITDNFPVEEMRKHHVNYIIGIDVQDSLVGRKKLQSIFEILTQVNNFRTIKAMHHKRKLVDLYIRPDIDNFSILSFDQGAAIIHSGFVAAQKLKPLLDSIATLQGHTSQTSRRGLSLPDSVRIDDIQIAGNTEYPRNYIRGKLKIPTDQKIAYQRLNKGLENLSATANFKSIHYRLIPQKNGGNNLRLHVDESNNKTDLRFSLHYDKLYKSGALLNFTRKRLFTQNDVLALDFVLGDNLRYKFDYFIDKGRYWSIGVRSSLNQFDKNVGFDFIRNRVPEGHFNVNKIQLRYLDITNQVYVETVFFNALRFVAGMEHHYTRMKTGTITDPTTTTNPENTYTLLEKGNLFGPYGYLEYDDYDRGYFPNHGFFFHGDFQYFPFHAATSYNFSPFAIVKGKLGYAFSLFPKLTLRLEAQTGFQIGEGHTGALNFFLGGYGNDYVNNIMPFFGYDFLAKSGNSFNEGSLQLDYHFLRNNHLMVGYNIANVGCNLLKRGKLFSPPDYTGFSLGYGIESFLGPLEIFYSYSPEREKGIWFFSLGYWF